MAFAEAGTVMLSEILSIDPAGTVLVLSCLTVLRTFGSHGDCWWGSYLKRTMRQQSWGGSGMFLGHDLSWWGFVIAVAAFVLMVPAAIFSNIMTGIVLNWFAKWSLNSLDKRIAKLEKELSRLEKYPALDEASDRILWGIQALRLSILTTATGIIIIVYLGIEVLANPESPAFKSFSAAAFAIGGTNFVNALIFRYSKGFREERSPYRRESLRKSIAELKEIRAKWGQ
jgi:hypothetical protein